MEPDTDLEYLEGPDEALLACAMDNPDYSEGEPPALPDAPEGPEPEGPFPWES